MRVSELGHVVCTDHKDRACARKALGSGDMEKETRKWEQICVEQKLETRSSLFLFH